MQGNTDTYNKSLVDAGTSYQSQLGATKDALTNQANDSKAAYTNTVLPALQNVLNTDKTNAGNAMSLSDAMDPNNAVASSTRDMYNTQAQGIQNQGLADYGVLAALGGQATANTIGGSGQPILGGQMQALQSANMGQASQAFGNAQNNANNLKLQGIQAGQNQSNWAYDEGQNAIGSYGNAANNYANANNTMNSIQNNYTNQESGIDTARFNETGQQAGALYNSNSSQAGLKYGIQNQQNNNSLAQIGQQYGTQQGIYNAQAQAANAAQSAKLGALGGITGAAIGYATGNGNSNSSNSNGGGNSNNGGGGNMQSAMQGAQLGQGILQGAFYQQAPTYQGQSVQGTAGYQPYNPYGGK